MAWFNNGAYFDTDGAGVGPGSAAVEMDSGVQYHRRSHRSRKKISKTSSSDFTDLLSQAISPRTGFCSLPRYGSPEENNNH